MRHNPRIILSLTAFCLIAGSLNAQTILDETWANGNRTTQDLPNSAQWFTVRSTDSVTVADNSMIVTTTDNGATGQSNQVTAYFTDSSSNPVTVGVGQVLKISYDLTFTDMHDGNSHYLHIGIFNSGTSTAADKRISADGKGFSIEAYKAYTGYKVSNTNLNQVGGNSAYFNKRNNLTKTTQLMTTGSAYSDLTNVHGAGLTYESDEIYSGTILIAHNDDDTMTLTQNVYLKGNLVYTVTATDTSSIFTQFDTIAFGMSAATADSMTLSNVKIELGTIPEPSTFATLSALAAVGVLLVSRRRKL